ncbi:rod shape-determining protein MreC [Ferrimicrobium acidiphilum]|uniref:Cell shape-determining protein MreC n=1 Tax=Ferrimicrobium acidiphilum DSM 19497 TaxID=1121877 RepID=A0A0D8FXX3_9ACTN|nr:rod shape-determining protein MreC [Ferrimicrobium acidiphilum]KJE78070.1 cell shape-determining protein MreC [Ferrimicrobium acidiphilum DSM 19497]
MSRLLERPRVTLAVLILLSVSLITINFNATRLHVGSFKAVVADVVNPTRSALDTVFRPLANAYHGVVQYPADQREIAQLRSKLGAIQRSHLENVGALNALTQLSRLTKLPFATTLASVPAEVIQMTPTNLQLTFVIDKGSANGVAVGNPVVGDAGLVGRVVQVTSTTSTVLMLTDPSSTVGVRIPNSGQVGAAVGQGTGRSLAVNLVIPGTHIRRGAVLVTSGLQGELFPPGLPVARVTQVSNPSGDLQESIRAVPLVNYAALQYVSVLKWTPGSAS